MSEADLQREIDALKSQMTLLRSQIRDIGEDVSWHVGTDTGSNLQNAPHPNMQAETLTVESLILPFDFTPATITANTDNYKLTEIPPAVLRLASDASRNLTGITGGVDGRVLILFNVGSFNIVLVDDATSTAANRFQLNGNLTILPDTGVGLWYDSTSLRWRVFAMYPTLTSLGGLTATRGNWKVFYSNGTGVFTELALGAAGTALRSAGVSSAPVFGWPLLGDGTTLTIASGVVAATTGYHLIDTESAGATDDLDTINGGATSQVLVCRPADDAHTVVFKDGTGNLLLNGDFTADSVVDTITLIQSGSFWIELARSNNG